MSISAYDIASRILDPDSDEEVSEWPNLARAEQLPPDNMGRVWYVHGGRGSGKTRTGAETMASWIRESPPGEWAAIGPTYGDARDVCVEGRSGLLAALGDRVRTYNRSLGEIRLHGGGVVWLDGADDGALRIQGKNLRGAWCDEVGLWRFTKARSGHSRTGGKIAWEESIRFAVRLAPAKIVATGTPKAGHPLVRQLMEDPTVVKTHMRTMDNIENLDAQLVQELTEQYGGTRLGRQELEGELIDEIEGALWNFEEHIEAHRLFEHPQLRRIVVAVDPSWGTHGDECGIVVAGVGMDGRGYVLDDRSIRATPKQWGAAVADAYRTWEADRILAEVNFQAEQVKLVMQTTDPRLSFKEIRVSKGKKLRAEPVLALYEQGKVSHVGTFGGLEAQMTEWVPEESDFSPDRIDALVFALTELMLTNVAGPARASSAARQRI